MAENGWVNNVFFSPLILEFFFIRWLRRWNKSLNFHLFLHLFPRDFFVRKIDGSFDPEERISPSNTASGLSIGVPQINPCPAKTKQVTWWENPAKNDSEVYQHVEIIDLADLGEFGIMATLSRELGEANLSIHHSMQFRKNNPNWWEFVV